MFFADEIQLRISVAFLSLEAFVNIQVEDSKSAERITHAFKKKKKSWAVKGTGSKEKLP